MKKNQVFNTKNLRTWVEVNESALRHNLRQARKAIGKNVKLMAVVKSNAYGHGLVGAAKVAVKDNVDYLGVDSVDEGAELRKAGIKTPVLILGYTVSSRLSECMRLNLVQGAYNKGTIEGLEEAAKKERGQARIHFKIETGTSRQGILSDDLPDFIRLLKKHPHVKLEGVYTHFSDTENIRSTFYKKQFATFQKAVRILEEAGYDNLVRHTASSAAIWLYPETHLDMVRLGISYYGLWPSGAVERIGRKRGITLQPALTWKTRVAQIKYLKKGSFVGYDRTEKLKSNSRIVVLPVGYGDGYPRKLSRVGEILIQGKRCRVLGRVCMNMIMVDVSRVKRLREEDLAALLGRSGKEEVSAEDMAQKIGTISYEVTTRINPLIPRIYV